MSEELPISTTGNSNEALEVGDVKNPKIEVDSPEAVSTEQGLAEEEEVVSPQTEVIPEEITNDPKQDDSDASNVPNNEARLEQLEKEHETLRSQYMRIAADFDNFRKRQSRDQDDMRLQLTCTTLSAILPIVDNFERARQQLEPQGEEAQALHRSYQGLYKQLVEVLKQLGVAPMRVVGQSFDPTLHEAVLREPSDQQPEDVITEELQRGYHLNGRVLRHALVKVSMGPGPSANNEDSSEPLKEDLNVSEVSSPNEENL